MAITIPTMTTTVLNPQLSSANDFIITEALVLFFTDFFFFSPNVNYWKHNLSKGKGCNAKFSYSFASNSSAGLVFLSMLMNRDAFLLLSSWSCLSRDSDSRF